MSGSRARQATGKKPGNSEPRRVETLSGKHAIGAVSAAAALDRRDVLFIALIVFAAALPRVLLAVSVPPLLHPDSDSYFEIAQKMWAGQALDLSRRTPLYSWILATLGRSGRFGFLPVILLQHLCGIASAVLCYLIARRFFFPSRRAFALAAGLVAALTIFPVVLEQSILSEPVYTFLIMAGLYLSLEWLSEERFLAAAGCGMILGLAALTRPIAAGILPLWAAIIFIIQGRRALRQVLLAGAAFSVAVIPLCIRNDRAMGAFALTESLGRNMISVTDTLVDYDHGEELPVKAVYREFLSDKRGPDAVIVYAAMPRLRRETHLTDVQIDRALARIGWEAVRAHPVEFVTGRLRRLPLLFRHPELSQWSILHPETYLPMVELIGRINPELVSRAGLRLNLRQARFDVAQRIYGFFALDATSDAIGGPLALLVLAGMAGILLIRPREASVAAALLLYACIATILLQPPNIRYRLPTLPVEILFAAAGMYCAALLIASIFGRLGMAVSARAADVTLAAAIAAWIVVTLPGAVFRHPAFDLSKWGAQAASQSQAAAGRHAAFRELQMAGRSITALYFDGRESPAGAAESVEAETGASGGAGYEIRMAYSCETRQCAGAQLQITFADADGSAAPPRREPISLPLARDRIDNDLFWEEIVSAFRAPPGARRMHLELRLRGGEGNLVIPYLSISSP